MPPVDVSGYCARMLDIFECDFERDACLNVAAWCEVLGDDPEGRALRLQLEAGIWQRRREALTA